MDESTASAPAPAAPAAPDRPRRWRRLRGLAFSFSSYLLGLAGAATLAVGACWWLLYTEAGAKWLLPHVPGLQISGIRGSLLGDFAAQRVELPLPGEGMSLRLQDLSWSAPRLRPAGGSLWLRVEFDTLRSVRVDLALSDDPSTDTEPI